MLKSNISTLIAEGASLKASIKTQTERLKEIEAEILKRGDGKHEGTDGTLCQVITGSPSIKPSAEAIESVKKIVGEEHAKTLFDRVVSFKPVKGFRDVVNALLSPAKANKIIALCEAPSASYVKWG